MVLALQNQDYFSALRHVSPKILMVYFKLIINYITGLITIIWQQPDSQNQSCTELLYYIECK